MAGRGRRGSAGRYCARRRRGGSGRRGHGARSRDARSRRRGDGSGSVHRQPVITSTHGAGISITRLVTIKLSRKSTIGKLIPTVALDPVLGTGVRVSEGRACGLADRIGVLVDATCEETQCAG
jgi:hypothetical protein